MPLENNDHKNLLQKSLPYVGMGGFGAYAAFKETKKMTADSSAQQMADVIKSTGFKTVVPEMDRAGVLNEQIMRGLIEDHFPPLRGGNLLDDITIRYIPKEGAFLFEPTAEFVASKITAQTKMQALKEALKLAAPQMAVSAIVLAGLTGIYMKASPILKEKMEKLRSGSSRIEVAACVIKEELEKRACVEALKPILEDTNIDIILSKYVK